MPGEFVVATERVIDADLERVVYGPGDRVPLADAIRYGLVPAPEPDEEPGPEPKPKRARRARKGPSGDRARRPGEDR